MSNHFTAHKWSEEEDFPGLQEENGVTTRGNTTQHRTNLEPRMIEREMRKGRKKSKAVSKLTFPYTKLDCIGCLPWRSCFSLPRITSLNVWCRRMREKRASCSATNLSRLVQSSVYPSFSNRRERKSHIHTSYYYTHERGLHSRSLIDYATWCDYTYFKYMSIFVWMHVSSLTENLPHTSLPFTQKQNRTFSFTFM